MSKKDDTELRGLRDYLYESLEVDGPSSGLKRSEIRKNIQEKMKMAEEGKDPSDANVEPEEIEPIVEQKTPVDPKMEKYVGALKDQLKEGDLLGGAKDAVTQAQLQKATGDLFARIQTSLASIGGGGLGEKDVQAMIDASPGGGGGGSSYSDTDVDAHLNTSSASNGEILSWNGTDYTWVADQTGSGSYGDNDVRALVDSAYVQARQSATPPGTLDSGNVTNIVLSTVDSAYVQLREAAGSGLDSSLILQLINDSYISSQIGLTAGDIALDSSAVQSMIDSAGTTYNTADHDSDTLAQVDSAYVQSRVTFPVDNIDSAYVASKIDSALAVAVDSVGLDSAQVLALITSTVDSAYVAARDSDILASSYTTADHDSDTLIQVDSAYVQARVGDLYTTADHDSDTLVQVDSAYIAARLPDLYDTPDHDSDTLVQVDSAYVQARQLVYGDRDVRELLEGDSGARNILPALDSTYDLGSDALRWKDIYLSGNTIHLGQRQIKSGGDAGVGLYVDGRRLAYADSAFEGTLTALTDVQVDSLTLAADDFLQWNGSVWTHRPLTIETSLTFRGSIDVTADSAPNAPQGGHLYVNTGNGAALGSYAGISGDSFQDGQTIAWSDSDNRWYQMGVSTSGSILEIQAGQGISVNDADPERPVVSILRSTTDTWYIDSNDAISIIREEVDSAYVQKRVTFPADSGLDSAQVLSLILSTVDSAYVAARDSDILSSTYTTADHDSDTLVQVDSAYVNARADHYTTANHDSDTLAQVDSAYVNARADHYTTADHDSDTLVQVDSAYVQARQLLGGAVTIDSVAPSGSEGKLWYDNTTSILSIFDSGVWDAIGGSDSGLDSEKVVAIIDSYVDSAFIIRHADSHFVNISGDVMTGTLQMTNDAEIITETSGVFLTKDHQLYPDLGYTLELQESSPATWPNVNLTGYRSNTFIITDSGNYLIGTTAGEFWYSTDGGTNWAQGDSTLPDDITGIAYHESGGGIHVATYDDGTFPVWSDDNGATWNKGTTDQGFRIEEPAVTRSDSGQVVFLAMSPNRSNGAWISSNGKDWNLNIFFPPAGQSSSTWQVAAEDGVLLAHRPGTTMYSLNGGNSWKSINNPIASGSTSSNGSLHSANGKFLSSSSNDNGVIGIYTIDASDFKTLGQDAVWSGPATGDFTNGSQLIKDVTYNTNHDVYVAIGMTSNQFSRSYYLSKNGVHWTGFERTGNSVTDHQVEWDPSRNNYTILSASQKIFQGQEPVSQSFGRLLFDGDPVVVEPIDGTIDSADVIQIVDSDYVQERMGPRLVAGGRFNYANTFTYDSAGVTPGRYVKNQFGISNIVRNQAGRYTVTFDTEVAAMMQDSYSYIVNCNVDYKGNNPTASVRVVTVNTQNANSFDLVAERTDTGDDGDYDNSSMINFTVIKV